MRVSFALIREGGFWDQEDFDVPAEHCAGTYPECAAVAWWMNTYASTDQYADVVQAAVLAMPAEVD
jgi:hypothetical protein